MKAIDIFCASQAATSILSATTMDSDNLHQQPSSSSGACNGGRAIDRHNPIIQDEKRLSRTLISTPPTTPTHPHHNKNKKSKNPKNSKDQKRKSISSFGDENNNQQLLVTNKNNYVARRQGGVLLGWGCTKPGDFISPATSSRFLLPDKALSESDQFDPLLKQAPTSVPPEKSCNSDGDHKSFNKKIDDAPLPSSSPPKMSPRSSSSSSLSSRSSDQQVVVLRVSLHCKGCERKMRKHISKMEGITSFDIDFMAKKVTVVGNITPLAVLTSISKVKNAKLLTPTSISAPPVPPMDMNFSEIKKQLEVV